jgi:hypothetical protein
MVATESNRLPSFKNRRALSPRENEPRERKSNPEKNLSSDREPSATSGLDIETKNFSATGRRRSFFVDIPFYRTPYLTLRYVVRSGSLNSYREATQAQLKAASYWLKTNGGPLTRFTFKFTVTSTRLAILMNGMPLFIP